MSDFNILKKPAEFSMNVVLSEWNILHFRSMELSETYILTYLFFPSLLILFEGKSWVSSLELVKARML